MMKKTLMTLPVSVTSFCFLLSWRSSSGVSSVLTPLIRATSARMAERVLRYVETLESHSCSVFSTIGDVCLSFIISCESYFSALFLFSRSLLMLSLLEDFLDQPNFKLNRGVRGLPLSLPFELPLFLPLSPKPKFRLNLEVFGLLVTLFFSSTGEGVFFSFLLSTGRNIDRNIGLLCALSLSALTVDVTTVFVSAPFFFSSFTATDFTDDLDPLFATLTLSVCDLSAVRHGTVASISFFFTQAFVFPSLEASAGLTFLVWSWLVTFDNLDSDLDIGTLPFSPEGSRFSLPGVERALFSWRVSDLLPVSVLDLELGGAAMEPSDFPRGIPADLVFTKSGLM